VPQDTGPPRLTGAGAPSEVEIRGLLLWSTSGSVHQRQRAGNALPACIGVEIVPAPAVDTA
jgi:hypothetical protein